MLPSGNETTVKSIHFFDQKLDSAAPGSSIVITLEDEVDCSRGDMIVKVGEEPRSEKSISATICQVNAKNLRVGQKYILQHGVNRVLAKIDLIEAKVHADFSGAEESDQLKLNDIGKVQLRLSKPVHFDSYHSNKSNGAFILIDEGSFDTVSVGFIE